MKFFRLFFRVMKFFSYIFWVTKIFSRVFRVIEIFSLDFRVMNFFLTVSWVMKFLAWKFLLRYPFFSDFPFSYIGHIWYYLFIYLYIYGTLPIRGIRFGNRRYYDVIAHMARNLIEFTGFSFMATFTTPRDCFSLKKPDKKCKNALFSADFWPREA